MEGKFAHLLELTFILKRLLHQIQGFLAPIKVYKKVDSSLQGVSITSIAFKYCKQRILK